MDIEKLVSPDQMLQIIGDTAPYVIEDALTAEQAGRILTRERQETIAKSYYHWDTTPHVFFKEYWPSFKGEMRILICTNDRKYTALRKKLAAVGNKSQLVTVSAITAAISPYIGMAAAALVPGCAILLYAVAVMGKNVLCEGKDLEVKLEASPQVAAPLHSEPPSTPKSKRTRKAPKRSRQSAKETR